VNRIPDMKQHQIETASTWMSRQTDPRDQSLFDGAFDVVLQRDLLRDKLERETDEKERKKIEKRLRGLDNRITPAVKRAAIEREPKLNALIVQYFRQFNGDTNISRCIRWVRSEGAGKSMQDGAMRARIKQVFGIVGRRGRPRGS
jgi:hypothetical protein